MGALPNGRDGVWLDFVADLLAQPLTVLPGERISEVLVDTFGGAGVLYPSGSTELRTTAMWPRRHYAPFADELREWVHSFAPCRHPLLRYYIATGDRGCMQVADLPETIVDRTVIGGWEDLRGRWGGIGAQVALPLTVDHQAFVLDLADSLSPTEMAAVARIQRLLVGLHRQVTAFSDWTTRAPAAAGSEAARFTPRELAVLDLLARGLTAAAIGRRLGIVERTVQKHLQHVYAKLGVGDRLAAVQRAQAAGVLPSPRATADVRTSRTVEVPAPRA